MNFLVRKQTEERFISHPELMGTNSLAKHFYYDSLSWLNRQKVSLIQYNPTLYYSKITCPVLAICGDADEKLDCETHLKGIKAIFSSANKKNYTIKVIKNVDHNYKRRNKNDSKYDSPFIHRATKKRYSSERDRKSPQYQYSKEMFDVVSAWIMRN